MVYLPKCLQKKCPNKNQKETKAAKGGSCNIIIELEEIDPTCIKTRKAFGH